MLVDSITLSAAGLGSNQMAASVHNMIYRDRDPVERVALLEYLRLWKLKTGLLDIK